MESAPGGNSVTAFNRRDRHRHSWAGQSGSGRLFSRIRPALSSAESDQRRPSSTTNRNRSSNFNSFSTTPLSSLPTSSSSLSSSSLPRTAAAVAAMGYDLDRFEGTVNEGLICCICRDVLEDPLQAPCEHVYCSTCIHGWLVHENKCPEDRHVLFTSDLRPLFRYMKNDLDRLQIRCRNIQVGCGAVCNLEHISRHELECEYHSVQCPSSGCTMMLERRHLEKHLEACEFRARVCPQGCGMQILSSEDAAHNCISELRTSLELLRSEMICKMQEQKHELELRLDAQRRHMVQKESALLHQIEEMTTQLSRLRQEVTSVREAERERRQELERFQLEQREFLDVIKGMQKGILDSATTATTSKNQRRKYSNRNDRNNHM